MCFLLSWSLSEDTLKVQFNRNLKTNVVPVAWPCNQILRKIQSMRWSGCVECVFLNHVRDENTFCKSILSWLFWACLCWKFTMFASSNLYVEMLCFACIKMFRTCSHIGLRCLTECYSKYYKNQHKKIREKRVERGPKFQLAGNVDLDPYFGVGAMF